MTITALILIFYNCFQKLNEGKTTTCIVNCHGQMGILMGINVKVIDTVNDLGGLFVKMSFRGGGIREEGGGG